MALPVLIGPNRCELIYNHDKQPLLELSLRVSLPVKELLHMLSQHAPPAKAPESKVQRSSTQGPSRVFEHKTQGARFQAKPQTGLTPLPQGSCSSDWQPSPTPQDPWGHHYQATWEPYPAHTEEWPGDWAPSSPQVEEQISQTYAHPPPNPLPLSKGAWSEKNRSPPPQGQAKTVPALPRPSNRQWGPPSQKNVKLMRERKARKEATENTSPLHDLARIPKSVLSSK